MARALFAITLRLPPDVVALLRTIEERTRHMATTEQVTELETTLGTSLDSLTTSLSGVSGDVTDLQRMLEEAQAGNQLDLTVALDKATRIAAVTGAFADLDAQNPATPDEPTV